MKDFLGKEVNELHYAYGGTHGTVVGVGYDMSMLAFLVGFRNRDFLHSMQRPE